MTESFETGGRHACPRPSGLPGSGSRIAARTAALCLTSLLSGAGFSAGAAPFAEAQIGWAVRLADDDSLLESRNAGHNFVPGSTLKLFTTWAALDLLGGDKTFSTGLYRKGGVQNGVLRGDLILRGGGDPGFGSDPLGEGHTADAIFTAWGDSLRRQGIRGIEGCVIGDGGYLREENPHPAALWEDVGNYYAGTVSGLSYNGNVYSILFAGAPSAGQTVTVLGTRPRHAGIARFDNRLLTSSPGSGDSAYIFGVFPEAERRLRGSFPAGRERFSVKGSLPNPPWTCAREFRDFLAGRGFVFTGADAARCGDSLSADAPPASNAVSEEIAVAHHVSAPLREIIRHANQRSDNNYAAQILALIGKQAGRSGDFRGGLETVYGYLDGKGFDRREIHLKDGNGLSRYNWISPGQMSKWLAYASRQKPFPDFRASLLGAPPTAAKLERYGKGWENRLWVKTGSLEGVAALAGYLRARSGKLLAFAIIFNNFEGPSAGAQKRFAELLTAWSGKY